MKKLTIARSRHLSAINSLINIEKQVKLLKTEAERHLENNSINPLLNINREYVLLKEKYLTSLAQRDQATKDMLFILEQRLIDEIDYDFFTQEHNLIRSDKRDTCTIPDKVLCVRQDLTHPECHFLISNFTGDPTLYSVVKKKISDGYMLLFSMVNPLNQNEINLTFDEVNRALGWLTGFSDKKSIIEKYQLSIFTDNLIPV